MQFLGQIINNKDIITKEYGNNTYVDFLSDQTISGEKTFNKVIKAFGGTPGEILDPSISTTGIISIGMASTTSYTGIINHRSCSGDSNYVNTAGFFVNKDGTAKFIHRRGSTSAIATNNDDSYMIFDATGFKVAYSGIKGSNASVEYNIFDSNNIDTLISNLDTTKISVIDTALGVIRYDLAMSLTAAQITQVLNNIGAAAINHTHDYLPLNGGTLTGELTGTTFNGYLNGTAVYATRLIDVANPDGCNIGSSITPVYFSGGQPVICSYTIQTSVPANAVFTDTVYTHPTTSGYIHIPSGGSSGQILRWASNGAAIWGADNNTTYTAGTGLTLSGTVFNHSNSVTAITTQSIYPITVDAQGHISGYGSAITLGTDTNTFLRNDGTWGTPSFSITETLQTITTRGATTTNAISITNTTASTSVTTGALIVSGGVGIGGTLYAANVWGAVWNDYAEFRKCEELPKAGTCIVENGDDTLRISNNDLLGGAYIVTDTFGFAIGKTDSAQTPVAVSGRVLAYTFDPRIKYKSHIGDPVCASYDGKIRIMEPNEAKEFPWKIIGTVSSVPDYLTWGENNTKVDNRVWILIK